MVAKTTSSSSVFSIVRAYVGPRWRKFKRVLEKAGALKGERIQANNAKAFYEALESLRPSRSLVLRVLRDCGELLAVRRVEEVLDRTAPKRGVGLALQTPIMSVPVSAYLLERETEMQRISDLFGLGSDLPEVLQAVVVTGMPCSGKSSLITEYAVANASQYSGGVFYLCACSRETLLSSIYVALSQSGAAPPSHLSGDDLVSAFARRLSRLSNWLVLIDEVRDISQLPQQLMQANSRGHVLVAASGPLPETITMGGEPVAGVVTIPNLSREAATRLLSMFSQRSCGKEEAADARAIVEMECVGLSPFLVQLAGSIMNVYAVTYGQMRVTLRQCAVQRDNPANTIALHESAAPQLFASLRLLWMVFVSYASAFHQNLVMVLSAFNNRMIPQVLAESVAQVMKSQRRGEWDELERLGIVSRHVVNLSLEVADSAEVMYSVNYELHRLLVSETAGLAGVDHIRTLAESVLQACIPGDRLWASKFSKSRRAFLRWQQHLRRFLDSSMAPPLHDEDNSLSPLFYLELRGLLMTNQVVKLIDRIDELLVLADGIGTEDVLVRTLGNWRRGAVMSRDLERTAALLTSRREQLGPVHRDTLRVWYTLTTQLVALQRFAVAERELHALLHIQREVLGSHHQNTLRTWTDLAAVMAECGRLADSETEELQLLAAKRNSLGTEHPSTLATWGNWATAMRRLGHPMQAEHEERKLIDVLRRVLGPLHLATLVAWGNWATSLWEMGRTDEAAAEEAKLLVERRRVLGEAHVDVLAGEMNFAVTLVTAGGDKAVEAERLLKDLLVRARAALGKEHVQVLSIWGNWASALAILGHYVEAEAEDRELLAIRRNLLGVYHPDTLTTWVNWTTTLWAMGRYAEVEPEEAKQLQCFRRVFGQQHHKTISVWRSWITTLNTLGHSAEAEAEGCKLAQFGRRASSGRVPTTSSTSGDLAIKFDHLHSITTRTRLNHYTLDS